jgi:hypothetical protein
MLSWRTAGVLALLILAIQPVLGFAAEEPAVAQPAPARADADQGKEIDKVVSLFQLYLAVITTILAIGGTLITIITYVISRNDSKREQRLLQQQEVRERERHERDQTFDAKLREYIEATIKYTQNSSGLVGQMTDLLATFEKSKVALDATEARILAEETARKQATDNANRVAREALDLSIFDDGFYSILKAKYGEIEGLKNRGNEKDIDPEVYLVEGMYQSLLRRDDDRAIRVWTGQVLTHEKITRDPRLHARVHYYIGLSQLKLGLCEDAYKSFAAALARFAGDKSYQLAELEALLLRHPVRPLSEDELVRVEKGLEELYRLLKSGDELDLGKMPRSHFRSSLVYLYGGFLVHIKGGEESLRKAEQILSEQLAAPANRTPALQGLQCALLLKQKKLTVAHIDGFIRQCDIAFQAADDPYTRFSIQMRKARYFGRRAVLREKQNDPAGAAADRADRDQIVEALLGQASSLRRQYRDGRIYSPFTRTYEPVSSIGAQLELKYRDDEFRLEWAMAA